MFNLISKIKNLFIKKPKPVVNTTIMDDKDLMLLNIYFDAQTEKSGLFFDINPYSIAEHDKMIWQAEKLAKFLCKISFGKNNLTQMILDSITIHKKQSQNHSLFFDNVLFFWDYYLAKNDNNSSQNSNDPLIRPSKAFKNLIQIAG